MAARWSLSLALLLALAAAPLCAADEGETGTCAAGGDNASCHQPHIMEDSVAQDIKQRCPLMYLPVSRTIVKTVMQLTPSLLPVIRLLGLWPADVDPDTWSDDYTFNVFVIIGRFLLEMYTTRDKSYVRVPHKMLDMEDVIVMERVFTPHTDVDGIPNFYAFEFLVPQFILDRVVVPLYTCFYGLLRTLSIRKVGVDSELLGEFDDALTDPVKNTWGAVLKQNQSMRDWVLSFYDTTTLDGTALWPKQMTDFSVYIKKDEWTDQVENAIAFHLIGTHRLESGAWTFSDVAGFESVNLPYRIALNAFSDIPVRPGMGRFGVDLYFNADGLPVLLQTPDKELVVRGDARWQYWKFVWRSTLVTGITLVDHLHMTHYRAATVLSRAVRTGVPPDHPMRRLMSIFTFGSIFINAQATHVLLGPNHLLHRATPFREFNSLSATVPSAVEDLTTHPAIQTMINETRWEQLDSKLKGTPFYADGKLLVEALRKLAEGYADIMWPLVCSKEGRFAPDFMKFMLALMQISQQSGYKVDEKHVRPGMEAIAGVQNCGVVKHILVERVLGFMYITTGWHRQVGFVGDYYADPSLSTMSWKDGEAFGRPRQHMIMSVINVFTSTRQPLLKEDYTHLFKGLSVEKPLTDLWHAFMKDLEAVEAEIKRRNSEREVYNINHSPEVVECSVSK